MGKNKKNNMKDSGKPAGQTGPPKSGKSQKKDGKPKKANPEDHLSHIPFRLREIMKSKDRMKAGPAKKIKAAISHQGKADGSQAGDIPVPRFKRGKKESEKAYLRRMDNTAKHVLFLTNNQIDRKPELEEDQQEKPAKSKSDKKKEHDKVRLQRLQIRKLDRQEDKFEKEMFVDFVPFGEVAMAPPILSSKPRKSMLKPQKSSKELLLNSLLGHTPASTAKPSMAKQRIMEEERERAVEAYRQIKKQKQQQQEARAASLGKAKSLQ